MDFQNPVFLEDVPTGQVEVEVETSATVPLNPLLDHDYNLKKPRKHSRPSLIPRNMKIRELKALYHCGKCGYATFDKMAMQDHSLAHKKIETPEPKKQSVTCRETVPKKRAVSCPECNKEQYLTCKLCTFTTRTKTNMKIHMSIHRKTKPIKCTECEHRVQTLKELIHHYKTRCHLCSSTVDDVDGALDEHSRHCFRIINK